MESRIIVVLLAFFCGYLLLSLCLFFHIFGKKKFFKIDLLDEKLKKLSLKHREKRERNLENYYASNRKVLKIKVDSQDITCEFIKANVPTKDTIICCHGYRSNYKNFISGFWGAYEDDTQLMYNLCLFDFSSCYEKANLLIPMGEKSKRILAEILEQTKSEFGDDIRVFLHGVSLGAHRALNFLCSNPAPDCVKGLIFDSGFIDMKEQFKCINGYSLLRVFMPALSFWFRTFYKESNNTVKMSMKNLQIPMLIFCGKKDRIISMEKNNEFLNTSSYVQTVFEEMSDHGLICLDKEDMYRHKLERFIKNSHQNRIALVGFMSAGKTTLGKMIAQKYNLTFVDLDEEICSYTGKTLDELFGESEEEFRKLELQMLSNKYSINNAVLACGGGTPQIEGSSVYLNQWTTIWLDLPAEAAFERSRDKKFARPYEAFLELCDSRIPIYKNVSDFSVKTDRSIAEAFDHLCELIDKYHLLNDDLNS